MTTWPYPARPGVPLNPGFPGAHWLKGYTEDAWMYDSDGGWWGPGYSHKLDAETVAAGYSYLGPCLTPDEAAALQKRCEEAERERDALRRDTSQQVTTDELVRRLQHLGDWQAADRIEALQARADRNAAGFARVDAEAERAKFLHKQEIAALQKRVADLEAVLDFYACVDHYQTHNAVAPNVVQTDRGAKARAALGGKDE